MKHFGTINKNTILNKAFSVRNIKDNTRRQRNYFELPLIDQETRNPNIVKKKRRVRFNFNDLDWARSFITDYNRFFQGLLDSFLVFRNHANRGDTFGSSVSAFITQLNNNFGPEVRAQVFDCNLPEFLQYRDQGDSSIKRPVYLNRSSLRLAVLQYSQVSAAISGPGSKLWSSYNEYRAGREDVANNSVLLAFIQDNRPDSIGGIRVFNCNPYFLNFQSTNATSINDSANLNEVRQYTESSVLQYISAELPANYDADYNNQSWLNLEDDEGNFILNKSNTSFIRYSHPVWEVKEYGNTEHDNRTHNEVLTNFIGSWYDREVKNNLMDYPFTTDPSLSGKDHIYVDMDDVCYCPLSGYPLKCVYANMDYTTISKKAKF